MKFLSGVVVTLILLSTAWAAYLAGTVTGGNARPHIEWGYASSTCSSSPCSLTYSSSGVTNVTWASTGNYQINFSAGIWASAPSCTIIAGGAVEQMAIFGSTTATAFPFSLFTSGGSLANNRFNFICIGPR